jgi:hypothetical protein
MMPKAFAPAAKKIISGGNISANALVLVNETTSLKALLEKEN